MLALFVAGVVAGAINAAGAKCTLSYNAFSAQLGACEAALKAEMY
jgi:hypothetical protein